MAENKLRILEQSQEYDSANGNLNFNANLVISGGSVVANGSARNFTNTGIYLGQVVGYPEIVIYDKESAANCKIWEIIYIPNTLSFRTITDDLLTAALPFLEVTRANANISTMVYGNQLDNPSHQMLGNVSVSKTISINSAAQIGALTVNFGANANTDALFGWHPGWAVFGANVANTNSSAIGMGYDSNAGSYIIATISPDVVWQDLMLVAGDIKLCNGAAGQTTATAISLTGPKWNPVTFAANCSNFGNGYANCAWYQDTTGRVHLRGLLLITGTLVSGQALVTGLPAPLSEAIFCQMSATSQGGQDVPSRVDVYTSGSLVYQSAGASFTNGNWVSLEGISYQTK